MHIGLISRRYATALSRFAEQIGEDRKVYEDVLRWKVLYDANREVREQLTSPVLSKSEKQALFREWMGNQVSPALERFFLLVLNHQREKYFHFILNSYERIYKERHGVVDITLTTAAPIGDGTAQQIAQLACRDGGKTEVRLHQQVDESLIGGFTFRMDDQLIDASLSRQLALLRQQFQ